VSLGIGFAEELLFRGWLLDELQRDYRPKTALWVDAAIYAGLHFIKPLSELIRTFITFPALLLLGITLVLAKRARGSWEGNFWRGRLGLPIGLHGGLVWGYYIINVGQLIDYPNQVPEWVTGIDRNPLAGFMGLLFLSALAFMMQRLARKATKA
jgi:membrane protease YdiL (CAAX protease family)